MCTVTLIPLKNSDFILTSNRDEAPNRIAVNPEIYNVNGVKLMYPKDKLSGGTWIGVSEKSRVICILNGAFKPHERQLEYRMSRGVVAKDFMVSENIMATIETYNLIDIEPFTMIIADWNGTLKFYELVWDGKTKHISKLPLAPKIWSSSPLYNTTMKQERLQWFKNFNAAHTLNSKTLLNFHKTAGLGNAIYGVIMDWGFVKTTSITQITKQDSVLSMYFEDLTSKTFSTKSFNSLKSIDD